MFMHIFLLKNFKALFKSLKARNTFLQAVYPLFCDDAWWTDFSTLMNINYPNMAKKSRRVKSILECLVSMMKITKSWKIRI